MAHIVDKHINSDDYKKLLAYCDASKELPELLVSLLARTGMRGDELIKLTPKNFNLKAGRVYIEASKNSLSRWLPIKPELCAKVEAWLAYMAEAGSVGMMMSDSKDPETQKRTLRRWVEKIYEEAIGPNQYTVHSLRHTFALRFLLQSGKDLLKTKLVMGHKSINSTAAYLQYLQAEDCHADVLKAVG